MQPGEPLAARARLCHRSTGQPSCRHGGPPRGLPPPLARPGPYGQGDQGFATALGRLPAPPGPPPARLGSPREGGPARPDARILRAVR